MAPFAILIAQTLSRDQWDAYSDEEKVVMATFYKCSIGEFEELIINRTPPSLPPIDVQVEEVRLKHSA